DARRGRLRPDPARARRGRRPPASDDRADGPCQRRASRERARRRLRAPRGEARGAARAARRDRGARGPLARDRSRGLLPRRLTARRDNCTLSLYNGHCTEECTMRKTASMFLLALLCAARARAGQDLSGDWSGTLKTDVVTLRLVFHVTAAADGSLQAT